MMLEMFIIGLVVGISIGMIITFIPLEKAISTSKQAIENCNKAWTKAAHAITKDEYKMLCKKYNYNDIFKNRS